MQALPLQTGWLVPAQRLHKLAAVLSKHGFAGLARRVLTGHSDGDLIANRRAIGERVARVLAELGPTYIKLGQLLATREDLFPREVTTALGMLHADVPPMKPKEVLRAIEDALGVPPDVAFLAIDPAPLAAASVGQVHRARLRSGERVVIKVQRPALPETVVADLTLLRWLASLLQRAMPEVALMDPLALLDAFERSLTAELDFRNEAENARRLERLLDGAPEVRVPRVHHEWTRRTLLVLEEVRGRRLGELSDVERQRARARLLRAFARQILDHGVFHADPHPGNLLVEDSGKIVLLDLGAVDAVDGDLRAGLHRLVTAMALGRKRALCDAVLALSPNGNTVSRGEASGASRGARCEAVPSSMPVSIDRARLERDLAALVEAGRGRGHGAQVLGQMVAVGRVHKLKLSPSLVALVRALALLDGVLRGLDQARDLVADLRRELVRSLLRRVGETARSLAGRLRAAVRRLANLLPARLLR